MIKIAMTSTLRRLSTFLLLLAVTGSLGLAREVRAIYFSGHGGPLASVYLVGEEVEVELELPQRNLSPAVEIPKGELYLAALPKPPASLEEIPQGAPKIRIPEAWQRCVLMFISDPDNPVFPARVIPINGGGEDFPKGSTRIYNISKYTVGGKFNELGVVIEPGKSATFGAPIQEFGSYPVAIDFIAKGDSKPTALFRSHWPHDPEARQILFVVPQVGKARPRIWGVRDHGWSKEPAPEKKR